MSEFEEALWLSAENWADSFLPTCQSISLVKSTTK